ncbi:MAG: hypothetical protein AB1465_05020 [Patescibacteria group bacterium]
MKILLVILTIFTLTMFVVPYFALAQNTGEPNIREQFEVTRDVAGGTTDPLEVVIGRIIKWVMGLIGVILVALFVYGGVVYATSAGNEDRIETGKKVMMYAIIGIAIIALAFVLTDYIIKALFPETPTGV